MKNLLLLRLLGLISATSWYMQWDMLCKVVTMKIGVLIVVVAREINKYIYIYIY